MYHILVDYETRMTLAQGPSSGGIVSLSSMLHCTWSGVEGRDKKNSTKTIPQSGHEKRAQSTGYAVPSRLIPSDVCPEQSS